MFDLQKMVDGIGAVAREDRSRYHLTLGQAIARLEDAPADAPVLWEDGKSPGDADSYRGYYADLAINDAQETTTVGQLLKTLQASLGKTFEGYKGGDYTMGEDAPLWRSEYGRSSGIAVMGMTVLDDRVVMVTKQID